MISKLATLQFWKHMLNLSHHKQKQPNVRNHKSPQKIADVVISTLPFETTKPDALGW